MEFGVWAQRTTKLKNERINRMGTMRIIAPVLDLSAALIIIIIKPIYRLAYLSSFVLQIREAGAWSSKSFSRFCIDLGLCGSLDFMFFCFCA
jgi:hypothetical protein